MDQQARQSHSNSQSTPVVVWSELQTVGEPYNVGKHFHTAKVIRKSKNGKEGASREYSIKKCSDSLVDFFDSRSQTMKASGKKAVSFRRMFKLHAKRCTALTSCPYISGVIAVVLEDNHFGLLSKWKEKGSLKTYIDAVNNKEQEPLPWKSVYRVAIDTILGLDYLHKGDEFHGNLKSSNILLGDRGGATLLAADIRFLFRSDDESDDLSDVKIDYEDSFLPYCPLETLARLELTKESDIYNFGICLFELLCFRNPYVGLSKPDIMEQIKSGNPLLIKSLKKSKAPKSLLILTKYCISPKRSYRPSAENVARFLEENKDAIENETDDLNALYLLDPRYAQKSTDEYLGEGQPTEQENLETGEKSPVSKNGEGKHPGLSVRIPNAGETAAEGATPKSALDALKRVKVPEPKSPIKSRPQVPNTESKLRLDPPSKTPSSPKSPASPSRNPRDLSPDSQDPLFNHPGRSPRGQKDYRPVTAPNPVIEREIVLKSPTIVDDLKLEELNISDDHGLREYVQPKILSHSMRGPVPEDDPLLLKMKERMTRQANVVIPDPSNRDKVFHSEVSSVEKPPIAYKAETMSENADNDTATVTDQFVPPAASRAFIIPATTTKQPQPASHSDEHVKFENAPQVSHELESGISVDQSGFAPLQASEPEMSAHTNAHTYVPVVTETKREFRPLSVNVSERQPVTNDPPTPPRDVDARALDAFIDLHKYPNPFGDEILERPDTGASVGSVAFDLRNSMSMTQLGLSQIGIHERTRDFGAVASDSAEQNDESKGYYPSFVPRAENKPEQQYYEPHYEQFHREHDSVHNAAPPDLSTVIFDDEAPIRSKSISTEFSDGVPITPSRTSSDAIFQKTSQFKQGDYGLTYVNKMNETQLVEFLKSPVPKGFTVYGHVRRTPDKNGYHFFVECGNESSPFNRLCAVAAMQSKMGSMSMSISSVVDGDVHCGVLKSNLMRNHFKYYDVDSPQKVSVDIRYFSTCPRKTKVALSICKERPATQLVNKMPVLVGSVYTLDFSQRVTERSLRNVQLCGSDNGLISPINHDDVIHFCKRCCPASVWKESRRPIRPRK